MSLSLAQARAWNLARTLMVTMVLFRADEGFEVMPETEFDGDPASIVHEYDPYS